MNDILNESKDVFEITYNSIRQSKEFKLFSVLIILSLFGIWISLYLLIVKQIEIASVIFIVSASFISVILMTLHTIIISKLIVMDMHVRIIEKGIKKRRRLTNE